MQGTQPQGIQKNMGSFITNDQRRQMDEARAQKANKDNEETKAKSAAEASSDILKDKLDGVSEEQKKEEAAVAQGRQQYVDSVKSDYGFEITDQDLEDLVFRGEITKEVIVVRGMMNVTMKTIKSRHVSEVNAAVATFRNENPLAAKEMIENEIAMIYLSHQIQSITNEKTGKIVKMADPVGALKVLKEMSYTIVQRMDLARAALDYCVRIKMGDTNEVKK